MANAANKEALGSKGGTDVYCPEDDKVLVIAEEDPRHPGHHDHMVRVDPEDPENKVLLASLRANGYIATETMAAFKDGERFVVRKGRRRLTFLRIVNKERLSRGQPPLRPTVILTKDPLLTDSVSNAMAKSDMPLVVGRRFMDLKASVGASRAAAAEGVTVAYANMLEKIIACPVPELHEAVNRRLVAVDVAARVVGQGTGSVKRLLAAISGKGSKKRASEAARAERPAQLKSMRSTTVMALAKEFDSLEEDPDLLWTNREVASLLRRVGGDDKAIPQKSTLNGLVERACKASARAAK